MGSERKALFFDIDGTISDFDGTVSPLTVEALKLAKEKGHYLFVCTGRPKCHVDLSLLPGEYDGMISCAGALVEYQGKKVSKESILELAKLAAALDLDSARAEIAKLEAKKRMNRRSGRPWWRGGCFPFRRSLPKCWSGAT